MLIVVDFVITFLKDPLSAAHAIIADGNTLECMLTYVVIPCHKKPSFYCHSD